GTSVNASLQYAAFNLGCAGCDLIWRLKRTLENGPLLAERRLEVGDSLKYLKEPLSQIESALRILVSSNNYEKRVGEDACPFTTLYWEFMDRHYDQLKDHHRMKFPITNLEKMRKQPGEVAAIHDRASELRKTWNSCTAEITFDCKQFLSIWPARCHR
ncbi:MAG: hypothetical protein ACKVHE_28195, partial [Planctomycetales bacterium]